MADGRIVFRLEADNARMKAQLAESKARLDAFQRKSQSVGAQISRSLASTFSPMKIIGAFIGAMAIDRVVAFGRAQFELIKKIDSTNKALKAITGSAEEYNRVKLMLSDTANKLGTNVLDLTESYKNFTAAAKTSALSTQEVDDIFKRVTKSASVLGLSTDQTKGAFKAFEQMLSKGTVQAEEIRGQLSERLPGAFSILAKSMGVSTQALNKMLKQGQVLADEVLPNFAIALEKAYGADKIERIDTLVASQNRATSAWIEFVESVDNGEGVISNSLKTIFESFGMGFTILKGLNDGTITFSEAIGAMSNPLMAINALLKINADRTIELAKAQEKAAGISEKAQFIFDQAMHRGMTTMDDFLESGNRLGDYFTGLPAQLKNAGLGQAALTEVMKLYSAEAQRQQQLAKEQSVAFKIYEDGVKGAAEASRQLNSDLMSLNQTISQSSIDQAAGMMGINPKGFDLVDVPLPKEFVPSTDALPSYVEKLRGAFDESKGIMTGYLEHVNMISEGVSSIMTQMATDLIAGTIIDIVNGKNPFQGILNILGDGLISLGKFLIVHSKVMQGIKAALEAGPLAGGLGFGIGVAAIAAGALLKKAATGANQKMLGGGGGGSRGSGGDSSFSRNEFGGQSIALEPVEFRIRGKDLVAISNDYNRTNTRSKSSR